MPWCPRWDNGATTCSQAGSLMIELSKELAAALDMPLSLATDERIRLPKGELYTAMALNGARQALDKAEAARCVLTEVSGMRRLTAAISASRLNYQTATAQLAELKAAACERRSVMQQPL